jgi:hypothetical protein
MAGFRRGGYTARMKIHITLLLLALFGVSGTAIAQWEWLDKDGRRVFSDLAPTLDVMEKDILKRPKFIPKPAATAAKEGTSGDASAPTATPTIARNAATPSAQDKELEAKKKQAADAEAAKRKAEEDRLAKAKAENCSRSKQAKLNFESGVRISRTNASGEREILDDSARAIELKQIQSVIDSDCK